MFGETLTLVGVLVAIIGLLFLPWVVSDGQSATFLDFSAGDDGSDLSFQLVFLLPVSAVGAGLSGLIGLFAAPKFKRALSILVLLFGLAGAVYYIQFAVSLGQIKEVYVSQVLDVIGPGFWLPLGAVFVFVVQVFIPRGKGNHEGDNYADR